MDTLHAIWCLEWYQELLYAKDDEGEDGRRDMERHETMCDNTTIRIKGETTTASIDVLLLSSHL
jgi:hypothetical protein